MDGTKAGLSVCEAAVNRHGWLVVLLTKNGEHANTPSIYAAEFR